MVKIFMKETLKNTRGGSRFNRVDLNPYGKRRSKWSVSKCVRIIFITILYRGEHTNEVLDDSVLEFHVLQQRSWI